jgi:hypothetical protein
MVARQQQPVKAMIVFLALVFTCGAVLLHYEGLRLIWGVVSFLHGAPRRKLLLVICGVLTVHWLEIALFSFGYWLGAEVLAVGSFNVARRLGAADYIAFSAETYTSLGLGDMIPVGLLRLLAGTETLTGLILIAWSASFTYLAKSRFWRTHRDSHHSIRAKLDNISIAAQQPRSEEAPKKRRSA